MIPVKFIWLKTLGSCQSQLHELMASRYIHPKMKVHSHRLRRPRNHPVIPFCTDKATTAFCFQISFILMISAHCEVGSYI